MIEQLTKENFWNEAKVKWPHSVAHFCWWIDNWKKMNHWKTLQLPIRKDLQVELPKYHDLPAAMQLGVYMQYLTELKVYTYLNLNWPTDFRRLAELTLAYINQNFKQITQYDPERFKQFYGQYV